MPITDGNPTQNITATVDPMAVAQIVRQMQQADAATAQKESRFEKKVKSLLESGNVDKDNLNEITALQRAAMEDLEEKIKSTAGAPDAKQVYARYSEAIQDALEKYTEGDEQLEAASEDLQKRTEKALAADAAVMTNYNNGQLDKRQIKSMAKEVVEKFSKDILKRDQSSKGPAITSGVTGTVANKAIENTSTAGNIDEIVEPHRREAYLKLVGVGQRWGKMKREDAENWAFKHATRAYKKSGSAA